MQLLEKFNNKCYFWHSSNAGITEQYVPAAKVLKNICFLTPDKLRQQKSCYQRALKKNHIFTFIFKLLNRFMELFWFFKKIENTYQFLKIIGKEIFCFSYIGNWINLGRKEPTYPKTLNFVEETSFLQVENKNKLPSV